MSITRRDLFRSTAAVGGAAALTGLSGGLAAEAVAGSPALARVTTRGRTLHRGATTTTGWRPVVARAGEPYVVRTGLGVGAKRGRRARRKPLLAFVQLSDVHICDSQSPARVEPWDRFSDDGGPGTYKSSYRPQEILTAQIAESMVREINRIGRGPVTSKPFSLAIQTGDNTDNAQYNEIRWSIDLLDGGQVSSDSGDRTKYEGVMAPEPEFYDTRYWHPDGTPTGLVDDLPRSRYGFPTVPGLLDAARAPFEAQGLNLPWYTARGNHDPLVQGNFPPTAEQRAQALGTTKVIATGKVRTVAADPDRRFLTPRQWVEEHFETTGRPVGHGFTATNRAKGTAYYTFDKGLVRFVVLDSVNPKGGQNGSLDRAQFSWLRKILTATKRRLVVVASHHTTGTMNNGESPRVQGTALVAELLRHQNVIAWVNGHTHTNNIWAHKRKGGGGFWEINTASHIDWPQQSRLLEITNNRDDTLSIFATMVDHGAPLTFGGDLDDPMQLAALGRELAANDWQEKGDRRGARNARNVELLVRAPTFLR